MNIKDIEINDSIIGKYICCAGSKYKINRILKFDGKTFLYLEYNSDEFLVNIEEYKSLGTVEIVEE